MPFCYTVLVELWQPFPTWVFREAEMVIEISRVVSALLQAQTCLEKLCIPARQQMRPPVL